MRRALLTARSTTLPTPLASLVADDLGVAAGTRCPNQPSGGTSSTGWVKQAMEGGPYYRTGGVNGRGYLEQGQASGTGMKWVSNRATGATTVVYVARRRSGSGRILSGITNNWLAGWWTGSDQQYYAEGWVSNPSNTANTTSAWIYTATADTASGTYALYRNGALVAQNSGGLAGPNGISTNGYYSTTPEYSDSDLYAIYVYDHVLTGAERGQIESYLSTQYGIALV